MFPRLPRLPGLPLGGGMNVLLLASGAYMSWEHEQGRHRQPNLLCPICWLNKIAPGPGKAGGAGPAEQPEQPDQP